MKTPAEQYAELSGQIAALNARVEFLERQLAPKAPAPAPKPPAWAGNGNPETGVNAQRPSVDQVSHPSPPPKWPQKLGGTWRNQEGEIVPDPNLPAPPPEPVRGPSHSHAHLKAMELVDSMLPLHGEK